MAEEYRGRVYIDEVKRETHNLSWSRPIEVGLVQSWSGFNLEMFCVPTFRYIAEKLIQPNKIGRQKNTRVSE